MTRQQIGQRGEDLAAKYLQAQGYTLIARNWHCQYGELDVVAQINAVLVFVEVKTRQTSELRQGEEIAFASITPQKRDRVVKSVYCYLDEHGHDANTSWRVDVLTVSIRYDGWSKVNHVEDAFDW